MVDTDVCCLVLHFRPGAMISHHIDHGHQLIDSGHPWSVTIMRSVAPPRQVPLLLPQKMVWGLGAVSVMGVPHLILSSTTSPKIAWANMLLHLIIKFQGVWRRVFDTAFVETNDACGSSNEGSRCPLLRLACAQFAHIGAFWTAWVLLVIDHPKWSYILNTKTVLHHLYVIQKQLKITKSQHRWFFSWKKNLSCVPPRFPVSEWRH